MKVRITVFSFQFLQRCKIKIKKKSNISQVSILLQALSKQIKMIFWNCTVYGVWTETPSSIRQHIIIIIILLGVLFLFLNHWVDRATVLISWMKLYLYIWSVYVLESLILKLHGQFCMEQKNNHAVYNVRLFYVRVRTFFFLLLIYLFIYFWNRYVTRATVSISWMILYRFIWNFYELQNVYSGLLNRF